MPDETTQGGKERMDELASLYLLGLLAHQDRRSFEEMLQAHDDGATVAFRSFADAEYVSVQVHSRPPAALKSN